MSSYSASITRFLTLIAAIVVAGCGSGGSGAGSPDLPPEEEVLEVLDVTKLSFCHDDGTGIRVVTDEAGTEVGFLCVVKPSDVEPGQLDLDPNNSGNGYGYHVVAFPKTITDGTRGAIMISGSYGSPYNPIHSVHLDIPAGTIEYSQWLIDGITDNFIVLQPAYNNPSSVNLDQCGPDADPIQSLNPNCHDLVRTWVLTGRQTCLVNAESCETIDALTLGSEDADVTNSFFNRVETLVEYLADRVESLPAALVTLDYSRLHVMGHSQGSGHSYMIAKHYHDVARACYLAGPRDYDRINDEFADWFTPVDATSLTPLGDMRGLVSNRDAWRFLTEALTYIGLIEGIHFEIVSDPRGTDGHREIFTSPAHSQIRKEYCF